MVHNRALIQFSLQHQNVCSLDGNKGAILYTTYLPGLHDDRLHIAWLPTSRTSPARTSFIGSIFSSSDALLLLGVVMSKSTLFATDQQGQTYLKYVGAK